MNKATKIIIAGVSSAALAGGIGAGLAYADPTPTPSASPTASASPSTTAKANPKERKERRGDHRRGLMAKALHGEATLGGKQHRVVVFQRGPVEKISDTSLTVKSKDGFTASYALTPETKVRKKKADLALSDLKVGDRVRVVATKDGAAVTANRIRALGE
ncbi:MAG TPA: DUF5666 domain-containing protein [Propionibacteriaceae bacterium]|nr:DUF5666 domain-containing protein [Propionibacteriaceae bacterium]